MPNHKLQDANIHNLNRHTRKTHIDFLHQEAAKQKFAHDFLTDEVIMLDEYADLKDMETNPRKRFEKNRRRNNEGFVLPESPVMKFFQLILIAILAIVAVSLMVD